MLSRLSVRGFKSLADVSSLELGSLTLVFGPNAVGKSNLLDALQVLSRLATADTAADALTPPVRGLPLETLTFPPDGLPGIIGRAAAGEKPSFTIAADLQIGPRDRARYEVEIAISPLSGAVTVESECLRRASSAWEPRAAAIETTGKKTKIRRKSRGHPWEEESGLNHTHVSNRRYSGKEYALIEAARTELASFRSYYLDPRVAMREAQPPQEVDDIGPLGEHIAPFLYRLKAEKPKVFQSVKGSLRAIIPAIDDVSVDLDHKRGVLDIEVRQSGTAFSSRVVSEGTLRVLGLISVVLNPWAGTLIAFEEPENGVHPRRIELIAQMLAALVERQTPPRQILLTTHSPTLCVAILRMARTRRSKIRLYRAVQKASRSEFKIVDPQAPLFADSDIRQGLTTPEEERVFEELQIRGFFDAA